MVANYSGVVFLDNPSGVLEGSCKSCHFHRFKPLMSLNRNHLTSVVGTSARYPLKRAIFTSDVAVQTDTFIGGFSSQPSQIYGPTKVDMTEEQEMATLSAANLVSILKWSKVISSDINLSSGTFSMHIVNRNLF